MFACLPWKEHLAPEALNQQFAQLPHICPSTTTHVVQGPWPLWQFLQGTGAISPAMCANRASTLLRRCRFSDCSGLRWLARRMPGSRDKRLAKALSTTTFW